MRAGTIWRTRAVPTRQGMHCAQTRDHRLRSLPTKHGHAALLITIGATREYQSDSSSKRPAASALSSPTHKPTGRPPPLTPVAPYQVPDWMSRSVSFVSA